MSRKLMTTCDVPEYADYPDTQEKTRKGWIADNDIERFGHLKVGNISLKDSDSIEKW
jgi:hypothetical protein